MRSLAYHQISSLSAAVGIGLPLGSPSAFNVLTSYSVGNTVLFASTDDASVTATWYCVQAGTGKTPSSNPRYWIELDANGIPVRAVYAAIQCESKSLRWTDDGTVPTSSLGNLLPYNADTLPFSELMYGRGPLYNIQIIESGMSAKANVTFYAP